MSVQREPVRQYATAEAGLREVFLRRFGQINTHAVKCLMEITNDIDITKATGLSDAIAEANHIFREPTLVLTWTFSDGTTGNTFAPAAQFRERD